MSSVVVKKPSLPSAVLKKSSEGLKKSKSPEIEQEKINAAIEELVEEQSDDEKNPHVSDTIQALAEQHPQVVISDKLKSAKPGSRRYLIEKVQDLCQKLEKSAKSYKLSRMKRQDLEKLLGELTNECAEACMTQEIEQIGTELDIPLKQKFSVCALYRMQLIAMRSTEMISKRTSSYTGFYLEDWAENIDENKSAKHEMQMIIAELLEENPWIETYLTSTSRYFMLLISSAMMSVRPAQKRLQRRGSLVENLT